jgi:hypothetical protein
MDSISKDMFEFTLWYVVHAQCYSHKKLPKQEDRTTSWSCQSRIQFVISTSSYVKLVEMTVLEEWEDSFFGDGRKSLFLQHARKQWHISTVTSALQGAVHDAFASTLQDSFAGSIQNALEWAVQDAFPVPIHDAITGTLRAIHDAFTVTVHDTIASTLQLAVHNAIAVGPPRFLRRFCPIQDAFQNAFEDASKMPSKMMPCTVSRVELVV